MTSNSGSSLTAHLVHLYTALGVVLGLLSLLAIMDGDFHRAGLWMLAALVVDSTDGNLARRFRVKERAPGIDGRRLDDIVDFLNYTFVPIVMISQAGWLPAPQLLWLIFPLLSSLYAFSRVDAKLESAGFFLGFPSYWNVVALYFLLFENFLPDTAMLLIVLFLSALTCTRVLFLYPSRFAAGRTLFLLGGLVWIIFFAFALLRDSLELALVSALYPLAYLAVSWVTGRRHKQTHE